MDNKVLVERIAFHHNHLKRIPVMNKKNFFAPLYLVIFVLFATMVGCSSKDEKSEVIERRSSTSTSTTIESPVMQEKKTTTTTTESR